MKYTILGFQQEKLIDNNLKTDDALLLRTIKDMYSSAGMDFIIENGKSYMWVNQNYLLGQIPIIGSKRKMQRMLNNLEDLGLIERILKHSRKGVKGNFAYVKPTMKLDYLQDYDPCDKMSQPYDKTSQPLRQNGTDLVTKCRNKDTSIIDTSIIDTTTTTTTGGNSSRNKKIYDKFKNNEFGTLNKNTISVIDKLIDDHSKEDVNDAMDISIKNNVIKLSYVEGILKKWKKNGKNVDDRIKDNRHKTKFHNFEQRSDKYTSEDIDNIAKKRRREMVDKLKRD